jgi:hypothetical protein
MDEKEIEEYERGSIHCREKDFIGNSAVCRLPINLDWYVAVERDRERGQGSFRKREREGALSWLTCGHLVL